MTTTAPCIVTCSWANRGSDGALAARVHCSRVDEGGVADAEAAVRAALDAPVEASHVFEVGAGAPWIDVCVGPVAGVMALCLVANARVLEIYESAEGPTTPLLTQEAQLSSPVTGLHAHFLFHGEGGALFPAGHAYRLKLFARTPKTQVAVVAVHVVLLPPSTPPCQRGVSDVAATSSGPAAVTAESAVVEALGAMQRHLVMLERRVGVAMDRVTQRLAALEERVGRLEAPPAAPDIAPVEVETEAEV